MPIVASIGGNTGNQTMALVIRALAVDQIQGAAAWRLMSKELAVSLMNGCVWGLLVGLFAWSSSRPTSMIGEFLAQLVLQLAFKLRGFRAREIEHQDAWFLMAPHDRDE